MFNLVDPHAELQDSYGTYIEELGTSERYPFPLVFPFDDFKALITRLRAGSQGIGIPAGFVANSTFWLVENSEIVGVSNLRHELTDKLHSIGGHIGFGVRPSAQGRGVGKELLRQTLIQASKLGIAEAVLTCDKLNRASAGVITANGGKLEAEYSLEGRPDVIRRYLINT